MIQRVKLPSRSVNIISQNTADIIKKANLQLKTRRDTQEDSIEPSPTRIPLRTAIASKKFTDEGMGIYKQAYTNDDYGKIWIKKSILDEKTGEKQDWLVVYTNDDDEIIRQVASEYIGGLQKAASLDNNASLFEISKRYPMYQKYFAWLTIYLNERQLNAGTLADNGVDVLMEHFPDLDSVDANQAINIYLGQGNFHGDADNPYMQRNQEQYSSRKTAANVDPKNIPIAPGIKSKNITMDETGGGGTAKVTIEFTNPEEGLKFYNEKVSPGSPQPETSVEEEEEPAPAPPNPQSQQAQPPQPQQGPVRASSLKKSSDLRDIVPQYQNLVSQFNNQLRTGDFYVGEGWKGEPVRVGEFDVSPSLEGDEAGQEAGGCIYIQGPISLYEAGIEVDEHEGEWDEVYIWRGQGMNEVPEDGKVKLQDILNKLNNFNLQRHLSEPTAYSSKDGITRVKVNRYLSNNPKLAGKPWDIRIKEALGQNIPFKYNKYSFINEKGIEIPISLPDKIKIGELFERSDTHELARFAGWINKKADEESFDTYSSKQVSKLNDQKIIAGMLDEMLGVSKTAIADSGEPEDDYTLWDGEESEGDELISLDMHIETDSDILEDIFDKLLNNLDVNDDTEDDLPGGKADDMPDEDFDPKQLEKGRKVEREHTDDEELADEIAKDHLEENKEDGVPQTYYNDLEDMEDKEKEGKGRKSKKESSLNKTAVSIDDLIGDTFKDADDLDDPDAYEVYFADSYIELVKNQRVINTYEYPEPGESAPIHGESKETLEEDGVYYNDMTNYLEFYKNDQVIYTLSLNRMTKTSHIVQENGEWEVKSKDYKKNLGKYKTKAGAEKRLKQVEYFKHKNGSQRKTSDLDDSEFERMKVNGDVWKEYYVPSDSMEWTDGTSWYNTFGQILRDPEEYDTHSEGYTPFGDEWDTYASNNESYSSKLSFEYPENKDKFKEGMFINLNGHLNLVLRVGDNYYNLIDVTTPQMNDNDVIKNYVNEEAFAVPNVTALNEIVSKYGEDKLDDLAIFRGPIWEKYSSKTAADISDEIPPASWTTNKSNFESTPDQTQQPLPPQQSLNNAPGDVLYNSKGDQNAGKFQVTTDPADKTVTVKFLDDKGEDKLNNAIDNGAGNPPQAQPPQNQSPAIEGNPRKNFEDVESPVQY